MLERRSASQNKTEHLQTFKLARPKGLVEGGKFNNLGCPTVHNPHIECSREFSTLSNLICDPFCPR